MDTELLSEINKELADIGDIISVTGDKAVAITNTIADKYIKDRSFVWWWESLAGSYIEIDYGDDLSWPIIRKITPSLKQNVYLFVTDDEPEPWPIFYGSLRNVGQLISRLWRFEYFITDENFEWLIFDTHHNSLIILGELFEAATAILEK